MVDVVVTAANVVAGTGAEKVFGTAGATITAGQSLYLDPTDNRYKLYDADSATAAVRTLAGIALNGAANGQPIAVLKSGPYTAGGTVTQGLVYVGSDTPGGIMPAADLESGDYTAILGVAISASVIQVAINNSGVAV